VAIADDGRTTFHGWYYLIYDLRWTYSALPFISSVACAMYRRAFNVSRALVTIERLVLLGLLLSLGITGSRLEALRLHYTQVQPDLAHWSIVGWLIDVNLLREST